AGDVGPLSATCVGWIEGGTDRCLPGGPGMRFGLDAKQIPILDVTAEPAPAAARERTYVVAVLEAQVRSLMPHAPAAAAELPGPAERQRRRLEGPVDEAA
ncbi:MAG TPA: hypothetical protein VK324_03690, partial [Tepidisphaeraceae bacterium]|nr:hypothetical protein [Tepidisphaeraceae bacterium]